MDEKASPTLLPNVPEYSVGEISRAIKRTLESDFRQVRVRGEITGFKRAGSGHLYFRLKDDEAVLDACCWRSSAARLTIAPEDGLEVVCVGRISAYSGRSSYQLIVDSIELAGEGALLKLLEDRRKRLAAEGLFDEARKRALPFLPDVIGVVTSPTGAVIRDILHRLRDRFPRRVLLWPVLVQGEDAAAQITAAIEGFNRLPERGAVPRPDVLIVARGGGSLEDLWAFNEEAVVRAAAASSIPLISAVGHETDFTLIDYAADRRAPTPTAAAEMAVPVRSELLARVLDGSARLEGATGRFLDHRRDRVAGLARGLPDPVSLIETAAQRLDDRSERLQVAIANLLERRRAMTAECGARLRHPRDQIAAKRQELVSCVRALDGAARNAVAAIGARYDRLGAEHRLANGIARLLRDCAGRIEKEGRLLESYSYRGVLARGFALVRDGEHALGSVEEAKPGMGVTVTFHDGDVGATIDGPDPGKEKPARQVSRPKPPVRQGSLF